MVKNKKASKRQPLAQRYNIAKKALAHERRERRAAKANPGLRKKVRRDPGIPNLNPFKAQILKRLEESAKLLKFQAQQQALRGQDMARRRRAGGEPDAVGATLAAAAAAAAAEAAGGMAADADEGGGAPGAEAPASLSSLAADAEQRGAAFASAGAAAAAAAASAAGALRSNAGAGESTRRAFYRHLRTVMEQSDIILQVLDARDPLACRAHAVEAMALSQSPPKRVVLVLNKIDLVPAPVVVQWLAHLRREFPTVAFKASTQQQRTHLSAPGGGAVNRATEAGEILTGSAAAGADSLLQLIKNYSRSHELKRAVTVGVVGYPNVGKSSLINSLKRSRAVSVSSTPGHTRVMQEVSLDAKVTLLDCPGIIFDDDLDAAAGGVGEAGGAAAADGGAGLLLRNCISLAQVEDPEAAVDGILRRCAPEKVRAAHASARAHIHTTRSLARTAPTHHGSGRPPPFPFLCPLSSPLCSSWPSTAFRASPAPPTSWRALRRGAASWRRAACPTAPAPRALCLRTGTAARCPFTCSRRASARAASRTRRPRAAARAAAPRRRRWPATARPPPPPPPPPPAARAAQAAACASRPPTSEAPPSSRSGPR